MQLIGNSLAFPCGRRPGVDAAFPGAKSLWYSVKAAPAPINLLRSWPPAVTDAGNILSGVDGIIGPYIDCQSGTAGRYLLPGYVSAISPAGATYGAIIRPLNIGGAYFTVITIGSASFNGNMYLHGTTPIIYNGGDQSSTLTCTYGQPYFIGCSIVFGASGMTHWVIRDLSNGTLQTYSAAQNITSISYQLLNLLCDGAGNACQIRISTVAFITEALTQKALLTWSKDPWSFWFPNV